MNQAQLIDAIAASTNVSKAEVGRVLEAQHQIAHERLKSGEEVTLPGLGKLKVADRAAKAGKNPKTGEAITIPAKRVPKFSALKALKDAVAQ